MLIVTIGPERELDEPDELGRTRTGYRDGMTDRELYRASRGSWVLGEKADELFALAAHAGTVRLAIEIERLVETAPGRRAIEGSIQLPGDEVYDEYVGKPVPVESYGNPVRYFDSPVGTKPCRCGCGAALSSSKFVSGHDAIALHRRIKQIGTIPEFIDWFDSMAKPFSGSDQRQGPAAPDGSRELATGPFLSPRLR